MNHTVLKRFIFCISLPFDMSYTLLHTDFDFLQREIVLPKHLQIEISKIKTRSIIIYEYASSKSMSMYF